jgi:hypothetical protein
MSGRRPRPLGQLIFKGRSEPLGEHSAQRGPRCGARVGGGAPPYRCLRRGRGGRTGPLAHPPRSRMIIRGRHVTQTVSISPKTHLAVPAELDKSFAHRSNGDGGSDTCRSEVVVLSVRVAMLLCFSYVEACSSARIASLCTLDDASAHCVLACACVRSSLGRRACIHVWHAVYGIRERVTVASTSP